MAIDFGDFVLGCAAGLIVGAGVMAGGEVYRSWGEKTFRVPIVEVRQGYCSPGKLEIDVRDLERNGKETRIIYDGKPYLLKLDEQGRPKIQAYELQPPKVVPKE